MAQQAVNTEAVAQEYDERTGKLTTRRLLGESFVAVRVDDLPTGEADRLAAEGKWYPLTTDANGQLRVVPPDWIKVQMQALEVWLRIEALLIEQRDLLREIA